MNQIWISTSIILLVLFSCNPPEDSTYELVWSDEFDQTSQSVDSSKWFMETLGPNGGRWYNNEMQHYTNRVDNAYVSEGTLKIIAKKEAYTDSDIPLEYTSARLNSKFHFTYGKVEVRAKLPRAQGTWPAIWTLGSNLESVGWPACGEIDIMEQLFEDFESIQCAVHTPDTYGDNTIVAKVEVSDVTENFHVYGLEWTPEHLTFIVDQEPYFTYEPTEKTSDNWPYFEDQYLLLNIAMGGNLGGEIDPQFIQDQMEIDYVRIYQLK